MKKITRFSLLKMWRIDVKGRDVAQPIWLSGCFEKTHFIAKNYKSAFLSLK